MMSQAGWDSVVYSRILKKQNTLLARENPLLSRLSLNTRDGFFAGESRIRLLEAVQAQGSITRAAKALPMSYKAAWDAIDAMNNLSEQALVARVAGGRQGGGTRLTEAGSAWWPPIARWNVSSRTR